MSPSALEEALKNPEQRGKLVKDRPTRKIWRFEVEGTGYYLKFYPRAGSFLKRLIRGNPAMREFLRLQWLQKAQINAPKAISVLMGMRLAGELGDAVIMEAIEPSIPLDQYLNEAEMRGEDAPLHRRISERIRDIIHKLAAAGLGHSDLHLGNFLLKGDELYLLDAYAVHRGGLSLHDLLHLGHSVSWYSTKGDLVRGWKALGPGGTLPKINGASAALWSKQLGRVTGDNSYFGKLRDGEWRGWHFKETKFARPWSAASGMKLANAKWDKAWATLLGQIESDQLVVLKRSASGDVLSGELILDGRPISVIIKRPRKKHLRRYFDFRGSRVRRAWSKAWSLVIRDIPTALPLMVMEKRTLGYVTDAVIVFERIEGETLWKVDLNAMEEEDRHGLFWRTGRLLRRLEKVGFFHRDAKASNFIVARDRLGRATPVLVDVDGIQRLRWTRCSIERLLTSMKEHRQYTPADSLDLCRGFAPYARIEREDGSLTIAAGEE